ncbi:MAG: invasin domain 3-containing protein, partial [Candidatus Poribacteria bacterium]|nr:invasin domain 3-containing protein [Candidatus Poribacteria bacterium]
IPADSVIVLTLTSPSGGSTSFEAKTTENDNYQQPYTPDEVGEWQIQAEFVGTETLKSSQHSDTFTIQAREVESVSLQSDSTDLKADGTTTATLTITLKDAADQALAGQVITLTADNGTVSVATDNGDGTYTVTYTAGSQAGTATVTAKTANGKTDVVQITLTKVATFVMSVLEPELSVQAGRSVSSLIELEGKDSFSGAIDLSATDLPKNTTAGFDPEQVKLTVADPIQTAQLTLSLDRDVEAKTYEFTVSASSEGGQTEKAAFTLKVEARDPDPTTITVVVDPKEVTLGDSLKVTGQLVSMAEPAVEIPADSVIALTLTSPTGKIAEVNVKTTENDNYQQPYTPDEVGEWQVKAEFTGNETLKSSQHSDTFTVQPREVESVSLQSDLTNLTVDGTTTATLTITLKDATDQALAGQAVTLTADNGAVSTVTDNGDGSYTSTYTAGSQAGTATVIAKSANGKTGTIQITLTVAEFVLSVPTPELSVQAGGSISSLIELEGKGGFRDTINLFATGLPKNTTAGFDSESVKLTVADPIQIVQLTLSLDQDVEAKTYEFTVSASSEGSQTEKAAFTLKVEARDPDPTTITVVADPKEVTLGDSLKVTGQLVSMAKPVVEIPADSVIVLTLTSPSGGSTSFEAKTAESGNYQQPYTPDEVGEWQIQAEFVGTETLKSSQHSDTFTIQAREVESVSLQSDSTDLTADGTTTATLTITLKDAADQALAGQVVTLTADNGTASAVTDNGDGIYTSTYTAGRQAGTTTVTAKSANGKTGTVQITLTKVITFVLSVPKPELSVKAGGFTTYQVTLEGKGGFSDTINLFASNLPQNTTASFNPEQVKLTSAEPVQTTQLTLTSGQDIEATDHTVTVLAISEGGKAKTATLRLKMETKDPDPTTITIVVDPRELTLGGSLKVAGQLVSIAKLAVEIPVGSVIALTLTSPSGENIPFEAKTAESGNYQQPYTPDEVGEWQISAEFVGTETLKVSQHNDTFTVRAREVESVGLQSDSTDLTADGVTTAALTITLKDTADQTVSGQAVTLTADSGQVSTVTDNGDGTYTSTYTAGSQVGTATVTAKSANGKTGTVQITLTEAITFALSVPKPELSVKAGEFATYQITLKEKGGFSDTINLFASNLPPNTTASFNPEQVKLTSAEPVQTTRLTLTSGQDIEATDHTVTVLAISEGGKAKTATLRLKVEAEDPGPTTITVVVDLKDVDLGDSIKITGQLVSIAEPAVEIPVDSVIALTLTSPAGKTASFNVKTTEGGNYQLDSLYRPDEIGEWQVNAEFVSTETLKTSQHRAKFTVQKPADKLTAKLAGDVNGDKTVNIFDLVIVAGQFGQAGPGLEGDVNGDFGVDVFDLVLAASNFGQSVVSTAPTITTSIELSTEQKYHIANAIDQLESNPNRSPAEEVALNVLQAILPERLPTQNQLLANYPNPFNPETWIPFQLSQDADVTITIYDVHGRRIRRLQLGLMTAGRYVAADQAAYWDGKTETGKLVASGTYFYQIEAGEYTETRKMIVLK